MVAFSLPIGAAAAEITGKVLDEGGFPLRNAMVTLRRLSDAGQELTAQTKDDGSYVLSAPFGEYSVEASERGFIGVRYAPIRVSRLNVRQDFRLPVGQGTEGGVYSAAELIGTLRTGDRRHAGARLCLSNAERTKCATANEYGEYELGIEPGKYRATVTENGTVIWQQEVDLPQPGEYRDLIKPVSPPSEEVRRGRRASCGCEPSDDISTIVVKVLAA
jgi:hypothetical protein